MLTAMLLRTTAAPIDSPALIEDPAPVHSPTPEDKPTPMDRPAPMDSPATEGNSNYAKEKQDTLETFKLTRHRPTAFHNLKFLDLEHSGRHKIITAPL
jgi:hypothetical protein